MPLQRSWSLPLELNNLGSTASGAYEEFALSSTSSEPDSAPGTPQGSEDESVDWLFPERDDPGSSERTHLQTAWPWIAYTHMITFRNLKRGTKHLRRRIRISMLSIVRAALLFALLNLICVALYKNLKSSFRETRLRHDLRGRPGRSWVFSHNDEQHGEDALVSL